MPTYLQAGGGGMQTSHNQSSVKAGVRLLLIGLVLQLVSYACFIVLVVHAHIKIIKDNRTSGSEPWWKIIWLLYISSICIMVSIYQEIHQYLLTPNWS
jgi:uncharacterized membrane protein YjfL (UPF0719 family)